MSNFTIFVVLTIATIYFGYLNGVNGQDKSCKSVVQDLTKRQLGGISKCTKAMKFKNGKDKAAKSNCILRCVMINEKLLNEDGGFTDEGIKSFINTEFAEDSRANVLKHFSICVEEFGSQIDTKEEYCKTYEPVIKCLTSKLAVICN